MRHNTFLTNIFSYLREHIGVLLLLLAFPFLFLPGCFIEPPYDNDDEEEEEEEDAGLYNDEIWPSDETREPCEPEEADTWRCNANIMELCRNDYWNPWYNCAWNGGTCVDYEDGTAECIDPPNTEVACPDPDGGVCEMCNPDPPMTPDDFENAVTGCCGADGNAYWGESAVVMQKCTIGCCAILDFSDTLVRHSCCSEK